MIKKNNYKVKFIDQIIIQSKNCLLWRKKLYMLNKSNI